MWEVLTEKQREQLTQMRAERAPLTEPPELPSLDAPNAGDATVDIAKLSPVFRLLTVPQGTPFEAARNGAVVRMAAHQRRLVADLVDVTRLGWLWIGLRHSDQQDENRAGEATTASPDAVEAARQEFLKAAEQVALLSILSEEQAKELTAAVAGR
jgi:hypothetical protein